jgi:hypothetical protein
MADKMDKLGWLASESSLNLMAQEDKDGNIVKIVNGETVALTSSEQKTLDDGYAAYSTKYDNEVYKRARIVAYPTWQDQLDMQYHDAVDGTTTWKDAVAKIKADNPKP